MTTEIAAKITAEINVAQFAALLRTTPTMLQSELAALPDEVASFRPATSEWAINEAIGHMIGAEKRGFAGRIQRILAEEHHACQTWDPNQVAQARHDDAQAASTLLAEFVALREQSIALVVGLKPEQLARSGHHPAVGELRISDLLYEWLYHDRNHLKQIESNIMAWFWPQMGNAQGFYLAGTGE